MRIAACRSLSPTILHTCCATCPTKPARGKICCSPGERLQTCSPGNHPQISVRRNPPIEEILMRKLVVFGLLVLSALLSGCGYNTLQREDEAIKSAWSEVLNQYQRRY